MTFPKKLKIPIVIIILISILVSYNTPLEAEAQGEIITKGLICTISGVMATFFVDKIFNGLKKLYSKLPYKIADFLGMGVLNFFFPPDVPASIARLETKEHVGDIIARCGAMALFDKISRETIAGVRTSGRNNNRNKHDPAFVRHWRNFKLQAQRRGENIFRSVLGSTEICPYFSGDIKAMFGATNQPDVKNYTNTRVGNLDPFHRRAQCTMPRGWNPQDFERNFVPNGGWGALVKLSEPQNNFYGSLIMSSYELAAQRLLEEESDQAEAVSGLGFTSRRGKDETDNCALSRGISCIVYKDILTPGSYIQQSASALVQQELAWITNTDEIGELIGDLTFRLLSRILDLSGDPKRKSSTVIGGKPPEEDGPVIEPPDSDTDIPPTPIPPTPIPLRELPDSIAAVQSCDIAGTTCLTAQWWKAGKAGSVNPTGECQTSNCVVLNHQIRDDSTDANIYRSGTLIFPLLGAPDYPNGTRADTCMRDGNTNYGLATNTATTINLSLLIPTGGGGSCSSPTPQCSDGIDNDNDGQADINGASGLPPDIGCSSAADNDEGGSGGGRPAPQCNDGHDNDDDAKIDMDDPGCSSITDDSESLGSVTLCADINLGSPCQIFTASVSNLTGTIIGDNNASSLTTTVNNQQVSVDLCTEPNYGNCTNVIGPRTGPVDIINSFGIFPLLGNKTISSISIVEL